MNIVFFTHPDFFTSLSMPRYAKMLSENMEQRGHTVEIWAPVAKLSLLKLPQAITKWLKYVDQYLIFPHQAKKQLKKCPEDTLFVFTDVALGLWVPHVANRHHVIHCHDFLAQRCAIGEVPGSLPGWTGRQYQVFIRKGYQKGKNFISVSYKTREELHRFLKNTPELSEVVYNGLNKLFAPGDAEVARNRLAEKLHINLEDGYLLHIGGNQWYKNRKGVIDIYNAWRGKKAGSLPLVMIGQKPAPDLVERYEQSPYRADIHMLTGVSDALVSLAYEGASVFLFPSLAEGFGWPIVEAMASGCLVITTNEAPMTEVAGDAAFLIPPMPADEADACEWSVNTAGLVKDLLNLTPQQKNDAVNKGYKNADRFDIALSMDNIEGIYKKIIEKA